MIKRYQDLAIVNKIRLPIIGLVLIISLFVSTFFPAMQQKNLLQGFGKEVQSLAETVALGTTIGLESGDLNATQKAMDFARGNPDVRFVALLSNGEVFSSYPKGLTLSPEILNADTLVLGKSQIKTEALSGEIVLGCSTQKIQTAILHIRITAILVSLGALLIGVLAGNWLAKIISQPLAQVRDAAHRFGQGDLSSRVELIRADEIGSLAQSFNLMSDNVKKLMDEVQQEKAGVEKKVEEAVRQLQSEKQNLLEGVQILQEYAAGDLRRNMHDLPGEQQVLTNALNTIRGSLQELIQEVNRLTAAARAGQLGVRGEAGKFSGSYRTIIDGFNATLENIVKPVNEAVAALSKMAQGDLTTSMAGDYQGDHVAMKESMNSTLASLNEILSQVDAAVEQMSSGAGQVSDSSQLLSQGATKQASSLQEVTASMNEIGAQTKQNAENASQANQLAGAARGNADEGNKKMKQMLCAMEDISRASQQISKIIKSIDEIAFQTNLLALNAAVEAARAGVHGKGFAVVAEEVRNLAQRSAKAAKETTELIENSVKSVSNGTRIADATAQALEQIVAGITKAADLVGEIASASKEQAQGIEQVNSGLVQIDQVTQANTASAEQSAAAAEELSGQASQLTEMLKRFVLNGAAKEVSVRRPVKVVREASFTPSSRGAIPKKSPAKQIALDDTEFGKF